LALGPTQLLDQWISENLSSEKKTRRLEAYHSSQLLPRLRISGATPSIAWGLINQREVYFTFMFGYLII
jgi:hypothetical protein